MGSKNLNRHDDVKLRKINEKSMEITHILFLKKKRDQHRKKRNIKSKAVKNPVGKNIYN